jgi:hypothetical protein
MCKEKKTFFLSLEKTVAEAAQCDQNLLRKNDQNRFKETHNIRKTF